ncbi:methylated-DNA--[protein]-cysteine S-methyltransferase [Paenarthrobacter sp. DKR-5]|uniref:methylated-DNA--[protein]-cysteine S-methyltransferase n=1 Tax=Paenarthrobacter sp. DKR-5 TaxID=2835535 RepID=UPI001BDCB259|nr:methylated-DNA--[protein]-cysteine S-methyltransferase [Paenarthrobacter sp. DKR-5]MBT1004417.1 methylated-DNA--[protein]-cysteine S-methyltransferase [Paenarthrobacter sp. DKR-5]
MRTHKVIDSPVGPLTLAATDGVLDALYMDDQAHRPAAESLGHAVHAGFEPVEEQLGEYFAGERTSFTVPTAAQGTPFQQLVWSQLSLIPYGETRTYGQIAAGLGGSAVARAVGTANGRNPLGIIVPCHRVVGSTGSLTGYAGGLDRKRFLLALESAHTPDGRLF